MKTTIGVSLIALAVLVPVVANLDLNVPSYNGSVSYQAVVNHSQLLADAFDEAAGRAASLDKRGVMELLDERVPTATKAAFVPVLDSLDKTDAVDEAGNKVYDPEAMEKRLRELSAGFRRVR